MEKFKSLSLLFVLVLFIQAAAAAQTGTAVDKLKKHINHMVQKVEAADQPAQKRAIMNKKFNDMITAFERVRRIKRLSESDKEALTELKTNISTKKDELNGLNGFAEVSNGELNNFAQYVQQDLEQADEYVTISVGALILIGLILLLL